MYVSPSLSMCVCVSTASCDQKMLLLTVVVVVAFCYLATVEAVRRRCACACISPRQSTGHSQQAATTITYRYTHIRTQTRAHTHTHTQWRFVVSQCPPAQPHLRFWVQRNIFNWFCFILRRCRQLRRRPTVAAGRTGGASSPMPATVASILALAIGHCLWQQPGIRQAKIDGLP